MQPSSINTVDYTCAFLTVTCKNICENLCMLSLGLPPRKKVRNCPFNCIDCVGSCIKIMFKYYTILQGFTRFLQLWTMMSSPIQCLVNCLWKSPVVFTNCTLLIRVLAKCTTFVVLSLNSEAEDLWNESCKFTGSDWTVVDHRNINWDWCLCMLNLERANQSIQQLGSTLEQLNPDGEEAEEFRGTDGSLVTSMVEEDKAAWSQKTQSEAGDSVWLVHWWLSDKDIVVHHLEIFLLMILLTDNTQSSNKILFVCVSVHTCACLFLCLLPL